MKNKKSKYSKKKYSGFSLLEMMISIFIFTLIIITSVSVFSSVTSTRHKSREIQKNLEEARTALDLMAKNMRMSIGLKPDGINVQTIYMLNATQGNCVSYRFNNNKLQINQAETPGTATLEANKCNPGGGTGVTYLNAEYVNVIESNVSGRFIVDSTSTTTPKTVGKATIILTIDGVNMQTTVSFRDYNNIVQ